jgi:hypothetical protein
MSPEQVQSMELTKASDQYSLGAVMYEMLTGFRPFRATSLSKLLNQIVFSTPPPIHTFRADVPEALEEVVARCMHKDPAKRYASCAEFAAELTRVYQAITSGNHDLIAQQERLGILRRLNFFHDFAHIEIRELLDAGEWREYHKGDEIVKEGEMDDRFYVIVSGNCVVESNGITIGEMRPGNCFGESSYVSGTRRTATIRAQEEVTVLSVSATLLEQLSTDCQLRFTKVFLMQLIRRLQGIDAS